MRIQPRQWLGSRWSERPSVSFVGEVMLVLVTFLGIERATGGLLHLPAQSYEQPYLFIEAARQLGVVQVVSAILAVVALSYSGQLGREWSSFEAGGRIRVFVAVLAAIIAWTVSAYGYNYYLGQGNYADRVLVLLFGALIWIRPAFVLPFLPLAFVLLGQVAEPPLGGTFLAHPLQVLHVLNLFAAAFLVCTITGRRTATAFVLLAACLVAGGYWVAGLAKLRIGWLGFGHLNLMPVTAYANGWLAFLEPSTVASFSDALAWLDWPMRIGVTAIEIGCLFFLWRRRLAQCLVAAAIAFHLGVFLLNGFLFWNWVVLDIFLLVLVTNYRTDDGIEIFGRHHFALSVLLIGSAGVWTDAPRLAWFDTPLTTAYHLQAVGASGARYTLPPTYFAPYQDVFTMSSFRYLSTDHPVLTGPYGVSQDWDRAAFLVAATDAKQVFDLEAEVGPPPVDVARVDQFMEFVRRFVTTRERQGEPSWLAVAIRPLRLYWSFNRGTAYDRQEPIHQVVVVERTSFYDGHRLDTIRESEVGRITIR